MPDRCKHGLDARFCSLCRPMHLPQQVKLHHSASGVTVGSYELEDVVRFLNDEKVRATYGAVAELVGGIAQGIGTRLTRLYSRSPDASWVVNASSGMPTGYR